MEALVQFKRASRGLEALSHLYLVLSYCGFGDDDIQEIPGVVVIPKNGHSEGVSIKDPGVYAQFRRLQNDTEYLTRKIDDIIHRHYHQLCRLAPGYEEAEEWRRKSRSRINREQSAGK